MAATMPKVHFASKIAVKTLTSEVLKTSACSTNRKIP